MKAAPQPTWMTKTGDESGVPALESIQSALYGAVRFAECSLDAVGLAGARPSRLICTPDGRQWTLAFGEHVFEVAILADGFSVRSLPREA